MTGSPTRTPKPMAGVGRGVSGLFGGSGCLGRSRVVQEGPSSQGAPGGSVESRMGVPDAARAGQGEPGGQGASQGVPVPSGVSALRQPGQRKVMVNTTMKGQRTWLCQCLLGRGQRAEALPLQ